MIMKSDEFLYEEMRKKWLNGDYSFDGEVSGIVDDIMKYAEMAHEEKMNTEYTPEIVGLLTNMLEETPVFELETDRDEFISSFKGRLNEVLTNK